MLKSFHKALFIDRDGIINLDHGYVYQKELFEFTPGIFELLKIFVEKEYKIFILTNQSGIARGYYNHNDFHTLTSWMIKKFKEKNISIEGVEYCPHLPTDNCLCRKPRTGMVDAILTTYNIDLENSFMIGDKQSDIDLALNANIKNSIAITTKKIDHALYHFKTILECKEYLDENQGKIL